jgi:NADPH:quinone reductase-like Zn-dependent oxidoreductase
MKAICVYTRGGPDSLLYDDVPQPPVKEGELLVQVYAAGITRGEYTWGTTWKTKSGEDRLVPVILGHELSGVVAETGSGVSNFKKGDAVFGLTDFYRNGVEAEYTIALPSEVALKPKALDYIQAAATSLSGLTAWQSLFDKAHLKPDQRVLIHGAAGAVGSFAVQFARWAGAHVIAIASERYKDFLQELGAEQIIDYKSTHFEDVISDMDVVFDTVGGDTLDRSWQVLKKGGALVSIVETPSQEKAVSAGVQATYFIVEPNQNQLARIGDLLSSGTVKPVIDTIFPLVHARQAYQRTLSEHNQGKIVLQIVE